VAKSKSNKAKQERKLAETMLPNLSGIKFKDAVKAFAQTSPPKQIKKAREQ